MPSRPRIVIVFTGGTIASKLDKEWGGVVPSLSGGQILEHLPEVRETVDVVIHEYGTLPGPHITPERMDEISRIVRSYVDDPTVDGVVVTHGTDTLEETAYYLDCTLLTTKPVVVVGAMRNSSEPDWDGPRNLRDGIVFASQAAAHDLGVTICMGGMITAASEASKTDTEDLTTFTSYDFGPLGQIRNGHVLLHREPLHRDYFAVEQVPFFVPLLKLYAGMNGDLIDICVERQAEGLVIEAFGVGNVTPRVFYSLVRAVEAGIPVVLTSRCPVGRIEHSYAYEGAGRHLHAAGVIFADYLNGQKARIKLMCALGAGLDVPTIRSAFEWVEAVEADS
ncbi:MAG TPA: asparaginase [Chlorobiota bacterium]|nr:asparaginase [Chlorobiota bacterium]